MKLFASFFSLFIVLSCSINNEQNISKEVESDLLSVIEPPFEGDFINDTIFTIDPKQDNVLSTPNGSEIVILANTIVDEANAEIKEEIKVGFNQYHSVLDVISSGIPMDYDTLDEKYSFETAGMFTLKAESKSGKTLKIKEGQQIEVNLASDKKEEQFNFYQLNEQTGQWTYESNDTKIKKNNKCDAQPRLIKPTKSLNDNPFVLDLDLNLSNYAELDVFKGIVWEYTGTEDSLDPVKNKMASTKWTNFELIPTNEKAYEYFLKMSNKTKTFTTKVKAILDGEDFDLALNKFFKSRVEREKKIEKLQKPIIRSVSIAGFGTYNYDYIYHIDAPAPIVADFKFDSESDKERARVMVLYEDDDVVVSYAKSDWNKFGLNKKSHPKIFAILPNNKIAIFKGNVKKVFDKTKYTFRMETLPNIIESKVDLLKAIQSI